MSAKERTLKLPDGSTVSALWHKPKNAKAVLVLAHGAGAGMTHKNMAATADGLEERGVAVLRYNFPYMEKGSSRPDNPLIAHAAVRAAITDAAKLAVDLPLFAGGRSFGARMTSQAQALEPLAKVHGLVFFAWPLHAPGKPGVDRAEHLAAVNIPMLFLQGTKDEFAGLDLLKATTKSLARRATLHLVDRADHSFHVAAKTGRKDPEVLAEILDVSRDWMLKNSA
ncbi:MAG: alpha/beta family hydrolase [Hyphomonadaceae bacterium]